MRQSRSRRKFFGAAGLFGLSARLGCGQEHAGVDRGESAGESLSYKGESMRLGLVTYQWGKDWNLASLLRNCVAGGVGGIELRTTHAHGVEPKLSVGERAEVRRMFADSGVVCLGPGSNERFDHPDPGALRSAINRTKEFVRLSHDIGGTGVKVKPNDFHEGIAREKTIDQIGKAIGELAEYALGFGQEIRLEVHGQCAELATIAKIIGVADHPSAKVCWNSNRQDLAGAGLAANFEMVANLLGETLHVRELDSEDYPYSKLMDLLVDIDYAGWVMLEASSTPEDKVLAMKGQKLIFERLLKSARRRAA